MERVGTTTSCPHFLNPYDSVIRIYNTYMEEKLNNFPEGTKRQDVIDELIDHDDVRAIVLKQFNYMRINGINLVQDADDLVNLYLKIAKKFPE